VLGTKTLSQKYWLKPFVPSTKHILLSLFKDHLTMLLKCDEIRSTLFMRTCAAYRQKAHRLNSMKQRSSWESATSQTILYLLCSPKVQWSCIHKNPPLDFILSQMNPVHILTTDFCKTHFNVILTSSVSCPEGTVWIPSEAFDSSSHYCPVNARMIYWNKPRRPPPSKFLQTDLFIIIFALH
jgi:hypothetical protein